ncbi:unnamed protein product [Cladocopium goreaui]|uniref:Transmembrane protein n=1 Tax=Cladocopium goreaui TaxID=2562237 RepID=A0A9P1M6C0_9DINO|nr:unnamed protein product [Cladocopium goreaui]
MLSSAAKAMSCSDCNVCHHGSEQLDLFASRSRFTALAALELDVPRRQHLGSFFEGPALSSRPSSFFGPKRRLDGGVRDPDGGAIVEDTSCPRPDMQENAHGTGLKAGIQIGVSTIFFLGIPIGIAGGFFYQIYEKTVELRKQHDAEAAEAAKVAEAKAKPKAKFKMKAKAKPKAKARAEEEESYSDED